MTKLSLDRRTMLQATGVAASASLFVDNLISPAHADHQADRLLRVRTNRTITSTDPGYMVGGFEMILQFACLPRLVSYAEGDEWRWIPSNFVDSVEVVDATTITFALKPGIMWYDGDTHAEIGELSAEDVKYSLERMKESEWKDKAVALDNVEVTGSHTGTIHLNQPFAPIFTTWLADGTGTIVCKSRVEEMGGKYDGIFTFYAGPYRVSEWVQKTSYSLEPNPNWPGPAPHINNVKFFIIGDDKAAEIGVEAGEIDISQAAIESIPRLQEDPIPGVALDIYSSTEWYWMGMNVDHPNLQDKRVRQAIQYAVDVDQIIEGAWGGVPQRARGIVPPGLIGHRTETKFETPDLEKAQALIDEAGASGMHITLKTINKSDRMAAAQIIQAQLSQIGLDVEVVPMDAGPFWALGLESEGDEWKDLELWIMQYGDSPDPSQMTQWYIGDQVGVWNWERWSDPEYDELFAAGLGETDPDKRHEIYIRMQEIMEDTGAYVWLMFPPIGILRREDLKTSVRPNGWLWYISEFAWEG